MDILATTLAGIALINTGAATTAAPVVVSGLSQAPQVVPAKSWTSPANFSARWMTPGANFSLGGYYSTWEGRSLEMSEGLLTVTPNRNWMAWVSKQNYLAKGRSSKSRFDMTADTYGFRTLIRQPDEFGVGGFALQVEAFRPSDATSRSGGSTAVFFPTKNVNVSLTYSDHVADYEAGYTSVRGAGTGKSDVIDFAMGREISTKSSFDARVQTHLVYQNTEFSNGAKKSDLKLAVYGAADYRLTSWLNLEGDLALMPFGLPIAGGRFTPLTSFLVYNPGSAVDGLKNGFVAYGSLRLVAHTKF